LKTEPTPGRVDDPHAVFQVGAGIKHFHFLDVQLVAGVLFFGDETANFSEGCLLAASVEEVDHGLGLRAEAEQGDDRGERHDRSGNDFTPEQRVDESRLAPFELPHNHEVELLVNQLFAQLLQPPASIKLLAGQLVDHDLQSVFD
jgi:hypothetical protein